MSGKPTILVADDDPASLDLERSLLEREGYTVIEATNGAEAVEAVQRERPRLVVLDLQMPVMHGFEAAQRIKTEDDPPIVVAVTVRAMKGERQSILAAGFDGYIQKPFDPTRFVAEVQRHLMDGSANGAGNDSEHLEEIVDRRLSVEGSALRDGPEGIDLEAIEYLRQLQPASGVDVFAATVEAFLGQLPSCVAGIRSALSGRDAQSLEMESHSLIGSSGMLGALRLCKLCRRLEEMARDNRIVDAEGLVSEVERESARVESELRDLLSQSGG